MFDQLFYGIDKKINNAGSDYALLFLFLIIGLLPFIAFIALKIPRVLQAVLLLLGLGVASYIPLTISKTVLDDFYLHTGLITVWYINHTPYILRFATLWGIGLLSISGLWLATMLIKDLIAGNPITTKAMNNKNYQDALELNLKAREEMLKNYSSNPN
jgi:hypothetical protein